MFKGMVQNDNLQILQNKLSRSTICKNLIGNDNLLKMIQNTVCKFCRECSRTTICKLQMMIIILSNSDHHIILILPLPYHQQQQGRTLSAILPRYLHQWPFEGLIIVKPAGLIEVARFKVQIKMCFWINLGLPAYPHLRC